MMRRLLFRPALRHLLAVLLLSAVVGPAMALAALPAGSGSVSGMVYFDANGDGVRSADEAGIAGVTVEAWDAATGGSAYYATTTTASNGLYQFTGLDARSYIVTQADAPGYMSTTGNSQTVSVGASAVSGIDFGDTLPYTVTGVVFDDKDGDGAQKPSEPGTPGVPVELYDDGNANGAVDPGELLLGSTLSDATGIYVLHDVRPGYRVLRIWPVGGASSPGGNQVGLLLISSDGFGTNAFYQNFPLLPAIEPSPACAYNTSIVSSFNNTAIAGGRTVWFTARLKAGDLPAGETTVYFENAAVQFPANGTTYVMTVPRAKVIFSPSATATSTTYDVADRTWVTTVSPQNAGKQVFLSGLAFAVPAAGLPGGIKPVTMGGRFSSDKTGITLQWEWSAAVYTSFSADYNALGVKPVSANTANPYDNGDIAGTPENFKAFVTAGARGGGGANYTGNHTPSALGSCVASATPPFLLRINCGSVAYTDKLGRVWNADRVYSLGAWGYTGGGARSASQEVNGTDDDFLYQKHREKPGEYRVTVPDGTYDVTLKFVEFTAKNAGERLMRISLEGLVVEPGLSVSGAVGKNAAFDRTYTASVSDGLLVIGLAKAPGASREPVVSAIEVTTHTGSAPPSPSPTPVPTATPSPTPTPTPAPSAYRQAVNAGSVSYTDGSGLVWAADKPYVAGSWGFLGGSARSTVAAVQNTEEDFLYQKYREDLDEYRFTVPNGSYEVTLKFAEFAAADGDDRLLRITIEGTEVEPGLSIFAQAGGRYIALDRTYVTSVTDGVLSIVFVKATGSDKGPAVSAVLVRSR